MDVGECPGSLEDQFKLEEWSNAVLEQYGWFRFLPPEASQWVAGRIGVPRGRRPAGVRDLGSMFGVA